MSEFGEDAIVVLNHLKTYSYL